MNELSYNNFYAMSDMKLHETIGNFIQGHRLQQNISQSDLANQAGISRSTLSLLERGENVALSTLIQTMRALNILHLLEHFVFQPQISPIEVAKQQKKRRKHAYASSANSSNQDRSEW